MFNKTHKNVTEQGILYQTPEFGDIVKWSDGTLAVVTGIRGNDHKGRLIIATTDLEGGKRNWPLAKWVTVEWKENSNYAKIEKIEAEIMMQAQRIAIEFQAAMDRV